MNKFLKYLIFFALFYVTIRLIVWIANQTVGLPTAGAADLFVTVGVLLVSGIAAYNLTQFIWRRR